MIKKLITGICFILSAAPCLFAGEFHDAVASGDLNRIKIILESDPALLESKDAGGCTPLICACPPPVWEAEIASFLLDKGTDIDAQGDSCMTPPHSAALMGYLIAVRLLVDDGAR